jgi:hypothetical protein
MWQAGSIFNAINVHAVMRSTPGIVHGLSITLAWALSHRSISVSSHATRPFRKANSSSSSLNTNRAQIGRDGAAVHPSGECVFGQRGVGTVSNRAIIASGL